MHRYKNLHIWMIIPFLLMQTGFFDSYWATWKTEQWMRHMHALSAMLWYALLIVQPYLATHGYLRYHRTWGIIGFFVAGATAFTAISLLPQDVEFGDRGGFGAPFTADFFYGIVIVELIMMVAFIYAVIMAIVKRRQKDEHALWLITTVFYIMMPGLGRGMVFPVFEYFGPNNWLALAITSVLIITTLIIIGLRLKKLWHPAIIIGIFVNIPTFFTYWIGQQPGYIKWLQSFMQYKLQ